MSSSNVTISNLVSSSVNIPDDDYVDLFVKTGEKIKIFEFIIELNSNKIQLQIEADSVVLMDVSLDVLANNLQLSYPHIGKFTIFNSSPMTWLYQPPVSLRINNDFKIKAKAISGTKRVERGLVVWGDV